MIDDKHPSLKQANVILINSLMKHDSDFKFDFSTRVIAFVCDMSVEYEELCTQTYLNFYRHLGLQLEFTAGILATKDCYLELASIQSYK